MSRFKGVFNWYGETIVVWTSAPTLASARQRLYYKLAKMLERDAGYIASYYSGDSGADYQITKEG